MLLLCSIEFGLLCFCFVSRYCLYFHLRFFSVTHWLFSTILFSLHVYVFSFVFGHAKWHVRSSFPAAAAAAAAAAAKSLQSCPTLCDPIDGSPPSSRVPGILQARILVVKSTFVFFEVFFYPYSWPVVSYDWLGEEEKKKPLNMIFKFIETCFVV